MLEAKRKLLQTISDCRYDVSKFAKIFLHYEPYDYNAKFLNCWERQIVFRAGRKVGKSRSIAAKAIHYAWYAPLIDPLVERTCDLIIVAPTLLQAGIIFDEIKVLVHADKMIEDYVMKETALDLHLKFINGQGRSRIIARAAGTEGKSIRGYNPTVEIVDEIGFVPRKVMVALMPAGLRQNARKWYASTPMGDGDYLYELCDRSKAMSKGAEDVSGSEEPPKWFQFHAASTDNPDVTKEYMDELKLTLTNAEYQQEVLGQFVGSGNALIGKGLIRDSLRPFTMPPKVQYSMGVDVAGTGQDSTVISLVAYDDPGRVYGIEMHEMTISTMIEVAEKVDMIYRKYRAYIDGIYVDSTGIGQGALDNILERGVPAVGVNFSYDEKIMMYNDLVKLFEKRLIFLGNAAGNYRKMCSQLAALRKEQTENKRTKIVSDFHDDYPDSLALACRPVGGSESYHVIQNFDSFF